MGRLLTVGIALGFASLHSGCGGGTLGGGGAGTSGGSAGAGGPVVLTGMGGGVAPTGAGGDPFTECLRPRPAAALPPNFLIALDTSATMNSLACVTGCGSASRWQIAVDAITATTSASEHLVNWGLDLFADGTNVCGTIDAVGVPFGPGAAQRIAARWPPGRPLAATWRIRAIGRRATRWPPRPPTWPGRPPPTAALSCW